MFNVRGFRGSPFPQNLRVLEPLFYNPNFYTSFFYHLKQSLCTPVIHDGFFSDKGDIYFKLLNCLNQHQSQTFLLKLR